MPVIDLAKVYLVASCLLAHLTCASAGWAGPTNPARHVVQKWVVGDGLPGNHVTRICHTREGYSYIGTTAGLARFDGIRFRVYTPQDGFRSAQIRAIHEDRAGVLWVGTAGAGLSRLADERFTSLTSVDGLPADTVTAIAEDKAGRLWVGTTRGLVVWDGRRLIKPTGVERFDEVPIMTILCTSEDVVLVGTYRKGLHTLDEEGWSESDGSPLLGESSTCYALFEDRIGRVWASTDHEAVIRRDAMGWTRLEIRSDPSRGYVYVQDFAQGPEGDVWCVPTYGNPNVFRERRTAAEEQKLGPDGVTFCCIKEDQTGGIWVGTAGMGLYRLRPPLVVSVGWSEGLATRSVHTVAEPEPGILWAGTRGSGSFRLIDGTFQAVESDARSRDSFYSNVILPTPDGGVWVGTGDGLCQLREGRLINRYEHEEFSKGSVLAMISDHAKGVWIGTSRGKVLHLSRGTIVTTDADTQGHSVTSLAQARDGSLWIGTRGEGLLRYRSGMTEQIRGGPDFDGSEVGALMVDQDDTLWIGTVSCGIVRLKDRKLDFFTTRHGLPSDTVRQLLDDGKGCL